MVVPSPTSSNRNHKRKPDAAEPIDSTEPSESGNVRKKVRWDGEITEQEDETDETADESASPEKICMAASCQFGRVGCAYYDPVTCKMYILEDSQESPHYDLATTLLEQISPNVVLTSSKADDGFIDVLRSHSQLYSQNLQCALVLIGTLLHAADTNGGHFSLRPHKEFVATKGRDRALSLRLLSELPADTSGDAEPGSDSTSEPRSAYDFMRRQNDVNGDPNSQRWNAAIRLANYASVETSPLCMGSVGALLDHLTRVRAVGELDDGGIGGLEIRDIEYIALKQAMQINADALFSLQIFDTENHASAHSDKTKEGLSLFGILNNTKTSLGRAMLREWLLRPSLSIAVIEERHDAVACFMRLENLTIVNSMHNHLLGIKNVPKTMEAMKSGKVKISDWQGIMKFAYYSVLLRDALSELSHTSGIDVLRRLYDTLDDPSYKEIGSAVNTVINWDESVQAGRICVRPHIDDELDQLKHLYNGIDEVLSSVAQQVAANIEPGYAESLNVVYFPQLGYLICVPMHEEWKGENGIAVMEGWTFQFSSECNVYFKSEEMRDMDLHIGDVHSAIVDKEIEIIQSLQEKVLTFKDTIGRACDICAELDCLLCFAEASRTYNFRRPRMSEDTVTCIKQGRHPLQELVVDTFVPNDIAFAGGGSAGTHILPDEEDGTEDGEGEGIELNSIVVCTGANACGKVHALRSHGPSGTYFSERQSVYLKQVALIQFMAQIGCFVPAAQATLGIVDKIFTRIQTRESVSKVKIHADHVSQELPIQFVHMQVLLTSSKGELIAASESRPGTVAYDSQNDVDDDQSEVHVRPNERITYLYRVQNGLWLNSHAALCAEIFGIPRAVVRRAVYVSQLLSQHEIGQLLDEEMDTQERAELAEAEDVCRKFLAWDLSGDADGDVEVKAKLREILGKGPLTQHVKRALSISNHNAQPVAFKVKTTAPKLYCVRPNSGRVEPGETVEVQVMLQAMKDEPPMNIKCKDKFLIQSTTITQEKEVLPLQEMWTSESNEEIHSQKIRVVYLPPEGQTVPEEDETHANMSSLMNISDSRFETVRHIPPPSNGHAPEPAGQDEHVPGEPEIHVDAPSTPPPDEPVSQEEQLEREVPPPLVHVNVHQPQPPSPQPVQAVASGPDLTYELNNKEKELRDAKAEIDRLRSLISSMPEPSTIAPSEFTSSEFRRRPRSVLSDDDGTSTLSPATEVGSYVEDHMAPPEGVPLQVVIIIALGVFVTTYLFF
ncbi:hypothetical protein EUX98_g5476 [Antrodiella citrinella]|uniref:MSP domain-containing protein n=1 Tax=Antrodiella citrinella TaxID=2447956 RepID=A0A4S4MS98_9APHY|nr:hypothetical protein EUX98_g5476 [Antrodiella citrinella]